ncbi:undecaprenyl-phosphate galactosephosphotransferase [Novosphingobium sp. Rr 2-17]|uniref:sugar transferase n=1 Tax=Novosphingobium sp. Rr 2-17 TaxID=555793 RepID=UPI0002699B54|nr:sugar transferase [Novosphingobium sp. Rr 2-17]EIZ81088.1 undecaprenyl-phosphate galactosephosphotransferase [Novosphingobium sp. Rr 2-17]
MDDNAIRTAPLLQTALEDTGPISRNEGWLTNFPEPFVIDPIKPARIPALPPKRKIHFRVSHRRQNAHRDMVAAGIPALPRRRERMSLWERAFDMVVAILAIVAFLPLIGLIAIAVRVTSSGSILFVQPRVGRHGKLFPCLKFRTMVPDAPKVLHDLLRDSPEARAEWARDQKLRNDPRVTPLGAFLRKSSLDELPQLFNILVGQMSVVGPRPIVEGEIGRYGSRIEAYCSVRPGLTGLWQISGRNDISYGARVRLDAFYASHKSPLYDFRICLRTVPAVLASRGCY